MAKQKDTDTLAQYSAILADINAGKFSPVYILMGEEPYYSDVIMDAILQNVLQPDERDFNQTIVYSQDTTTAGLPQISNVCPEAAGNGKGGAAPCKTGCAGTVS